MSVSILRNKLNPQRDYERYDKFWTSKQVVYIPTPAVSIKNIK
jgi:hypothetical protein